MGLERGFRIKILCLISPGFVMILGLPNLTIFNFLCEGIREIQ